MRCSIIILNWNGEDMLRQYLPSVLEHTTLPDCEVVVADNGSTDGSLQLLEKYPQVRLIRFEHNYGFAEGYNKALAETNAKYTVLLNSDVEVTKEWLAPMLDYLDLHPQVAAVQPKILSWNSKEELQSKIKKQESGISIRFEHAGAAGGYLDRYGYPYCRGRLLSQVEEDRGQYDTEAQVFWTSGACMCVRTNIFKECGGLDAAFFAHMEEIDLCWRLNSRGWLLMCLPQSVVYHLGGGALGYENPRKTYLNFRNNLLMLYKNLPSARLPWVMMMRTLLDYVACMQALLTGNTQNAKAILQARLDYHRMKKQYASVRQENLHLTTVPYPATISPRSIIFDHYILKKC